MSDEVTVKKERKRYGVSQEKFVETWNLNATKDATAQEVANILGMPKNIVLARKANYIKAGIELLPLRKVNPRKLDVEKLNEIAKKAATIQE